MELRDYNGTGRWSCASVLARYEAYARELAVAQRTDITAWPVMDGVIAGIERGDRACIEIGVEFIEDDQRLPFGRTLKSNTARALRRAELSEAHVYRLRERIVRMLLAGSVPREFREYTKLLRHIGVGEWWPTIEAQVSRDNPHVMRFYNYLKTHSIPIG
jgi:hypothetical protein